MENTSIIFFGKPNSFESYELKKNTIIKNNHSEPQLKPSQADKDVLHYYVKNSFYYLELYSFANAFEAGRPGIVIGVCIKSEQPLAISERNVATLSKLLAYFKGETLSGTMFKDSSLENYKFNLNWDTIYKTIEYVKTTFKPKQGKLTLLLVEDFEHKIQQISDKILKYSNLYISSNSKIFHELINNEVFFEAGSKLFVVDNQKIKEYKEPVIDEVPHPLLVPHPKDLESDFKRLQIDNAVLEREKNNLRLKVGQITQKAKKLTRWLICSSAACLLFAVAFFFESNLFSDGETGDANSKITALVQENDSLKTKVANLQNQLTQAQSAIQRLDSSSSSIVDILVNNNAPVAEEKAIAVKEITLSETANVDVGKTITLTATITPRNATNNKITWSSNNTKVATVDTQGVVTGKKGTATTTIKATAGGKTASCEVTVNAATPPVAVKKIKIKFIGKLPFRLNEGGGHKLVLENAENKDVEWSSSDDKIAYFDVQQKKVLATEKLSTGESVKVTISVKTTDGKESDSIEVTVQKKSENRVGVDTPQDETITTEEVKNGNNY